MCADLPAHLHPAVHAMVSCWDQPLLPIEGMYELVQELKQAGYRLYLLTNASRRVRSYLPRLEAYHFFDDMIVSAEEGILKPDCNYFLRALNRFGLKADECFFVDDMPANVEGAAFCGIPGAVFHGDAQLLRSQMKAAGINLR